jgi:hypothetical protein
MTCSDQIVPGAQCEIAEMENPLVWLHAFSPRSDDCGIVSATDLAQVCRQGQYIQDVCMPKMGVADDPLRGRHGLRSVGF